MVFPKNFMRSSSLIVLSILTGCGSGGSGSTTSQTTPVVPPPATNQTPDDGWQRCALPPGYATDAQCRVLQVPLDWDDPNGRQIDLAVLRFLPTQETDRDIWLIDGGPGLWGENFAYDEALQLVRDMNVYIPAFRGTGASSFMQCSASIDKENPDGSIDQKSVKECFDDLYQQYGDQLNQFNSYNAAQDIKHLINEYSPQEHHTTIYGLSFGGYTVQRYLTYTADQVDSVVFDSAMHMQPTMHHSAYEADIIGHMVLDYCAEDDFCKNKLGGDPRAFFENTYQGLLNGNCPLIGNGEDQFTINQLKSSFEVFTGERRYSLIPAYIFRLNRCNDEDMELISGLADAQIDDGEGYVGGEAPHYTETNWRNMKMNGVLSESVSIVEGFVTDMTKAEFLELNENLRFTAVTGYLYDVAEVWDVPRIPTDFEQAESDLPMLILHTDLDNATIPYHGKLISEHFNAENQYYIEVPRMKHYTGLVAWHNCPKNILSQFLENPNQRPDSSCVADIPAIDFTLSSDWGTKLSLEFFGIDNLWPESL